MTLTARRARTRRLLLDAALHVFAEEGFGRSTVEQVCERAGFTRGAFYSNFTSLEELFLEMWAERSRHMVQELRARLSELPDSAEPLEVLRAALRATPVDGPWYRVTAEFTAHALRQPDLREVVAAREESIANALMPLVVGALRRVGRTVPDRQALGQALVAVHDGTMGQVLLAPDGPDGPAARLAEQRREQLFLHVLYAYSRGGDDGGGGGGALFETDPNPSEDTADV
ncbi:TetR/AcrR family transcriptional regulator [Phaeacidiphilus oryzae]|uniref:TetR/AcrR family transcriptional regulator n=1 Tax=Phaeacidiphilus oryzae TaxID=348818 RepID=UPI0007C7D3FD|nr:TetR/AcrR family transcriptional regulator [Phaeacidiphilus oryzae]